MSARVRLAGKLPGDEPVNGIDQFAEDLCDRYDDGDVGNPAAVLFIGVARVRKYEVGRDEDGTHRLPLMEVTRLEVLGVLGKESTGSLVPASAAHQQLLLKVAEARTGATPLPIDAVAGQERFEVIGDDQA